MSKVALWKCEVAASLGGAFEDILDRRPDMFTIAVNRLVSMVDVCVDGSMSDQYQVRIERIVRSC